MKQYYSDPRLDKAAAILASFSPDIVADMRDVLTREGTNVMSKLFGREGGGAASSGGQLRPFALFSRTYIADEDFRLVWLGFTTIMLSSINKPAWGNDEYETVLKDGFALPSEIAKPLANQIESYDPLKNLDAAGASSWTKIKSYVSEGARKVLNWGARVAQLPWYNDQSQKADLDFLYELRNLGRVVDDLMARSRLMSAQAMISSDLGVLNAQVASGDVAYGDIEVGAVESALRLGQKNAPQELYGDALPLYRKCMDTHHSRLRALAQRERASQNGDVEQGFAWLPVLANLASGLVKTLKAKKNVAPATSANADKSEETGDLYGDIADNYGDAMADAWLSGDPENILDAFGDLLAESPDTTGDPELDAAIIDTVTNQTGDAYANDPEIGNAFTRMRIRNLMRKANRRKRKAYKRAAKQRRKNALAAELARAEDLANRNYDVIADIPDQGDQTSLPPDLGAEGWDSNVDQDQGPDAFNAASFPAW